MIKYLPFLLFIFLFQNSNAQNDIRIIKGNVVDSSNNQPIKDVTISIFKASDTSLINFAFTTPNGNFELTTKIKDSLLMVISQLGYREVWKKLAPNQGGWWWNNEKIKLARLPYEMKEVQIVGSAIRMRGDTIEIAASHFKVMPGSDVSQLFAKIPGFKLDVNGNLTVDGSKVSKIMVDGSDFFGNNPGLVSKNLKADMVQTVQVYEDKDIDGVPLQDQTKTINLKLKKGKKNGMFGDVLAGYGTDKHYEAGIRLNSFKNDRKVSFISNSNNINGTGFDFGFENWHGDSYMFRNGSGNSDNYYSSSSGSQDVSEEGNINRNNNVALTYFNEFKKKRKFSFDIGLDNNQFKSTTKSISQNLLNDSTYQKNENNSELGGNSLDYYISTDYTRKVDSTAEVSFSFSSGQSKIKNTNTDNTIVSLNQLVLNEGSNQLETEQNRNYMQSVYKYSRRARKNKNIRWNIELMGVNDITQLVSYQFLNQNSDTLNLKQSKERNMQELNIKTGLKLPIYRDKWFYSISSDVYSKGYINSQMSKNAVNPFIKNFLQEYSSKIDSLSLGFNNGVIQSSVVNSVSFRNKKFQFSTGVTYLHFSLKNSIINGLIFNKNYERYLPYINYSTWDKKIGYLSLGVSKSVDFPQANDLMPIQNLSDPYNRMIGNNMLSPQDKYTARAYYRQRKFLYLDQISMSINYTKTNNYISYSRIIGENGIVYQLPINLNGYQNFGIYSNFEKVIQEKLNLKLNYQMWALQTPQKINNEVGINSQLNNTISPGIGYTINDKFDVDLDYTVTFLNGKNQLNKALNFKQTTQALVINLRGVFWDKTEVSLTGNFKDQRQVPGIGKIIPLVNCYVQQPLDKAKKYSLKLSCFDIFKQNVSLSRSVTNGGFIISESNQLQRYFMITLVRKLNKSGDEEDVAIPVY